MKKQLFLVVLASSFFVCSLMSIFFPESIWSHALLLLPAYLLSVITNFFLIINAEDSEDDYAHALTLKWLWAFCLYSLLAYRFGVRSEVISYTYIGTLLLVGLTLITSSTQHPELRGNNLVSRLASLIVQLYKKEPRGFSVSIYSFGAISLVVLTWLSLLFNESFPRETAGCALLPLACLYYAYSKCMRKAKDRNTGLQTFCEHPVFKFFFIQALLWAGCMLISGENFIDFFGKAGALQWLFLSTTLIYTAISFRRPFENLMNSLRPLVWLLQRWAGSYT